MCGLHTRLGHGWEGAVPRCTTHIKLDYSVFSHSWAVRSTPTVALRIMCLCSEGPKQLRIHMVPITQHTVESLSYVPNNNKQKSFSLVQIQGSTMLLGVTVSYSLNERNSVSLMFLYSTSIVREPERDNWKNRHQRHKKLNTIPTTKLSLRAWLPNWQSRNLLVLYTTIVETSVKCGHENHMFWSRKFCNLIKRRIAYSLHSHCIKTVLNPGGMFQNSRLPYSVLNNCQHTSTRN